MAKDKNPKVAGQILDVGGERIAIIRGPLADALDINNWNIVSDTTTKRSPEEEAAAKQKLEDWERHVKANPPKRIV
ncbi:MULTISPECIES: hypothetical protein [Hyphomicrobiales]|uniref:hypothetical protein n=1 Tax=Hyphomicrobiales TaxID=356 RepID=UPI002119EFB2|nr:MULTISPECIES: hypothetical protein [Hyphomicrobiales]MCQ9147307.1 hypothetical protein [Ochrobactrum sp. BTU2]MDH1271551.1 hypothetical protein [Agrobacterium pusense]MDX4076607.1 hypothetical protein [Brucella sp. NBRC 113783]